MTGAVAAMAEFPQIEIPAGDEDGHALRQSEQAADAVAQPDRDEDHGGDAKQKRCTGGGDRGGAQRGPEQHDRDLQQRLRAERDAGAPASGGAPERPDQGSQENGQHERLEPGALEEGGLQMLDGESSPRHGQAEQKARSKALQAAGDPASRACLIMALQRHGGTWQFDAPCLGSFIKAIQHVVCLVSID